MSEATKPRRNPDELRQELNMTRDKVGTVLGEPDADFLVDLSVDLYATLEKFLPEFQKLLERAIAANRVEKDASLDDSLMQFAASAFMVALISSFNNNMPFKKAIMAADFSFMEAIKKNHVARHALESSSSHESRPVTTPAKPKTHLH